MPTVILLLFVGCASEKPLTKEELRIRKLYYREMAEDKEYYFKPAGFTVRPVLTPYVRNYMKNISSDGIEFSTDFFAEIRDTRFYVGKLSTYFFNTNMYDSLEYALSNIKSFVENSHKPFSVKVIYDSLYTLRDHPIRKFRWNIVNGGTFPLSEHQLKLGYSKNAEMIGAIIESDKGTYLVTLVENNLPTVKYKGWNHCSDGWDEVSDQEATQKMENKFTVFIQNISFDTD